MRDATGCAWSGLSGRGSSRRSFAWAVKEAGMGDSRAAIDGESPLGRWPSETPREPERQSERQASGQGRQPGAPRGAAGDPYAARYPQSDDRTRLDLPAYNDAGVSDDPNAPRD